MKTTEEKRHAQFRLEKELRTLILNSTNEERLSVTSQAYTQLFEMFPEHSALLDIESTRRRIGQRCAAMIRPLTMPGQRVLEVGCGRGDVLVELARDGLVCVGIEPSRHMVELCGNVPNVTTLLGSARRLEFPDATFDVVFSQQVLEHVHPDDVPIHFAEAFRVLRPTGFLAIETPNRRTGPQDVSRGFVAIAGGLHLKEWSLGELRHEFRAAGFVRVQGLLAPPFLARRSSLVYRLARVPAAVKHFEDLLLALLPGLELRTLIGKVLGVDDIFLIGQKPTSEGTERWRART